MEPVKFEGANDVLTGPAGTTEKEVGSMIFHRGIDPNWNRYPVITSCWQLSDEEKLEVIKTGKVYLRIWSDNTYPLSLSAFNPVEHGWVKDGVSRNPNHPLLQP